MQLKHHQCFTDALTASCWFQELSDWLQYRHGLLEEQLAIHVPITEATTATGRSGAHEGFRVVSVNHGTHGKKLSTSSSWFYLK